MLLTRLLITIAYAIYVIRSQLIHTTENEKTGIMHNNKKVHFIASCPHSILELNIECKCPLQFHGETESQQITNSPQSNTYHMSRVMRKPDFCICENKDADQLRGNREADQRLCFRYSDSTIPLLSKSKISRF